MLGKLCKQVLQCGSVPWKSTSKQYALPPPKHLAKYHETAGTCQRGGSRILHRMQQTVCFFAKRKCIKTNQQINQNAKYTLFFCSAVSELLWINNGVRVSTQKNWKRKSKQRATIAWVTRKEPLLFRGYWVTFKQYNWRAVVTCFASSFQGDYGVWWVLYPYLEKCLEPKTRYELSLKLRLTVFLFLFFVSGSKSPDFRTQWHRSVKQ